VASFLDDIASAPSSERTTQGIHREIAAVLPLAGLQVFNKYNNQRLA
jgi:hypothetical protein